MSLPRDPGHCGSSAAGAALGTPSHQCSGFQHEYWCACCHGAVIAWHSCPAAAFPGGTSGAPCPWPEVWPVLPYWSLQTHSLLPLKHRAAVEEFWLTEVLFYGKTDQTGLMENSAKWCAPKFLPLYRFRILNILSPNVLLFNFKADLFAKVHVNHSMCFVGQCLIFYGFLYLYYQLK